MKKLILFGVLFFSTTVVFARQGPGSRADVKFVSTSAIAAEWLNTGMILQYAHNLYVRGYEMPVIKRWTTMNLRKLFLLRKLSLVGLSYTFGDFVGTQIYENLSVDDQEALGEIIGIMVENSSEALGLGDSQ